MMCLAILLFFLPPLFTTSRDIPLLQWQNQLYCSPTPCALLKQCFPTGHAQILLFYIILSLQPQACVCTCPRAREGSVFPRARACSVWPALLPSLSQHSPACWDSNQSCSTSERCREEMGWWNGELICPRGVQGAQCGCLCIHIEASLERRWDGVSGELRCPGGVPEVHCGCLCIHIEASLEQISVWKYSLTKGAGLCLWLLVLEMPCVRFITKIFP